MIPEFIKLDDRYCGVFLSKRTNLSDRIINIKLSLPISVFVYESSTITLAIGIGEQHAEPIFDWLKVLHDLIDGSSFIAGVLPSRQKIPPQEELYFFRSSIKNLDKKTIESIVKEEAFFCFIEPSRSDFYILTTNFVGEEFFHQHSSVGAPIKGLKLCICSIPKVKRTKSSEYYDPIKSQIKEVLNSSSIVLNQKLAELKELWKKTIKTNPPHEFNELELKLKEIVKNIKSSIRNRTQMKELKNDCENMLYKQIQKEVIFQIDMLAYWIDLSINKCTSLISQLNDYVEISDPFSSSTSYEKTANNMILHVSNNYISELLIRGNISDNFSIISVFGKRFSISTDLLGHNYLNEIFHTKNTVIP